MEPKYSKIGVTVTFWYAKLLTFYVFSQMDFYIKYEAHLLVYEISRFMKCANFIAHL